MANVLFKRGAQKDLPAANAASDGVFYLTTDTNRLYVGQGTNLKLLNQTVQIVDNISNLPTTWTGAEAAAHTNDFFYCVVPNVLAVWNGTEWKQINKNTDTQIQGTEFETSSSSGVTTVTYTVTELLPDNNSRSSTASFGIEGAGGITASTTGDNVLLTGTTYSIGRTVDGEHNEAAIVLTDSHSTTSSVAIKAGDNVTLASTGTSGIVISAVDTIVEGAEISVDNGALTVQITDSQGTTTATTTGVGVVLHDGSRVLLADASGVTSNGAIYSAAEIDNMFRGLDGMTYKGTIASAGTVATVHTLPTTSVRKGDVYVVSDDDLEAADLGTGVVTELAKVLQDNGIHIGDMFIATGTEGADGFITSPQWTFVPSGNDSAAQFTYNSEATTSTNTLTISNGLPEVVASVTLTASTGIVVTSSSVNGNDLNASISHATVTTTATTSTAASASSTISAISSLTLDNGHVTGYNVETFSVPEYAFTDTRAATASCVDSSVINGTRVATATNAGANDLTIGHTLLQDSTSISSSIVKLSSSSIILEKGNDGEVVMNVEWGTF